MSHGPAARDEPTHAACLSCRATYPDESEGGLPAVCPSCGGFWGYPDGFPRRLPSPSGEGERRRSVRRWAAALGFAPDELPDRELGRGPFESPFPDVPGVLVFQEGSAPDEAAPGQTGGGTFKERGAEVLASVCARRRLSEVFLDSSGNAGLAMAAACTARGIACRVLVPESTPEEKLERLRQAGADPRIVPGDRQAAADAAAELAPRLPYASHVYQPFFPLGVATLGWEIAEAIERGHPVERIVLPAGNGSLLLGVALGLAGLPDPPALHAVQLSGYASLAPDGPGERAPGTPKAAGIAVARPPRRAEMAEVVAASGGDVTVVTEAEIAEARRELARRGHPTDPTGATAWAGLRKRPDLQRETTAVILTSWG